MTEPFVLEIRRGAGEPRSLTLEVGQELPPLSIGSGADWRVDADGMEEVHAFVYFDGQQLHVQSAVPARPVRVNGRAVGTEWTSIAAPSTLAVADARLVFCPLSQASAASTAGGGAMPRSRAPTPFGEDAPTRMQMPAARDDDEATGHIEVPNFDDEATRALPVPQAAKMMAARRPTPAPGGQAPPAPLPAPVAAQAPPPGAPPVLGPDLLAPAPLFAPPPPPPPPPEDVPPHLQTTTKPALRTDGSKLAKAWRETSLVKKATLVLLPLAFVMVIFGFEDDPAPPKAKQKPAASASSAQGEDEPPKKKKPKKADDDDSTPAPSATTAPTPSHSASAPGPTPPGPGPAPSPSTSASAPGSPKTDPAKKSAEREAVDAVAAGQYELAAKLYEQLAKDHPDVPAYKEAARILRAKAKK